MNLSDSHLRVRPAASMTLGFSTINPEMNAHGIILGTLRQVT